MMDTPAIAPRRRALPWQIAVLLIGVAIAFALDPGGGRRTALAAPLAVYDDALAPGWVNCSWDSGVDFATSAQVYSGGSAIRLTLTAPRGGLCLAADRTLEASAYASLRFAARADQNGQRFQAFLYDGAMQPAGYVSLTNAGGDPVADAWKVYTIPLASLGVAGRQIKGIAVQSLDATTGRSLYLDQIELVDAPTATPAPAASPAVTSAPAVLPSPSLLIYGDALAAGWGSCSWGSTVNFGAGQPYSGSRAIAATATAARGGVCLSAAGAIDTTPYSSLHFAARTTTDGRRYQVFLYDAAGQPVGAYLWLSSFAGDPTAAWRVYDIPLRMLGGEDRPIKGVAIQQIDESSGGTLYLDEVAFTGAPAPSPTPTAPIAPAAPIALGAYISGAPASPAQIDAYTSLTGVAPSVVMWYVGWGASDHGEFDPAEMNAVTAHGAIPMVTWMPWDHERGPTQPTFSLKTIVTGNHDAYIRRWAAAAAAWGQPLYLRFAHEMNGTWYPWSPGLNGNTSADYIAAWRHVHGIFQQEGAGNVRWVWSPNVLTHGAGPFTEVYPGDAYVDWVALGGYNFGPTQPYQVWRSLAEVFGHSYDALAAMTSKPMMIAETASAEIGGNKAGWITRGLLSEVPSRLPRVRAVIWFHENKEADWRINSSPATLTAFRQVAASASYRGRLP
ncbi:MAG: glycoside hydrolase family 26 protein [Dehalococcoidia bacterium]